MKNPEKATAKKVTVDTVVMPLLEFAENSEGVHLMDNEHTLCGDAFDIDSEPDDDHNGPPVKTKKRVVTCERCKQIIYMCRSVKTA